MAHFSIQHLTQYHYDRPVFIEPHFVRLRPRTDWRQRLDRFSLQVSPEPSGMSWNLDSAGNECLQVWFEGLHKKMSLAMAAEVQTLQANPFDYLLVTDRLGLPAVFFEPEAGELAPFLLQRHPAPPQGDRLARLVDEIAGQSTLVTDFLLNLNRYLFETLGKTVREEPGVMTPEQALECGEGACRDATLVFMEACRRMGIPARYVSGYQAGDTDEDLGDLHAWAEAYVPEAGWRGFDPTHGLAVADQHVVVAVGADPDITAPLSGSFRGTGAGARMHHMVQVLVEDAD